MATECRPVSEWFGVKVQMTEPDTLVHRSEFWPKTVCGIEIPESVANQGPAFRPPSNYCHECWSDEDRIYEPVKR